MKKLRLDDLQVESFDVTASPTADRGTVRAHYNTTPDDCNTAPVYCLSDNYSECRSCIVGTCNASCGDTCGGGITCDASCQYGSCPPQCVG